MPGLILLLVFAAGYAVQRGSICAVAAVHALVAARRPERFLAFFLCAAVALAVMATAALAGFAMLDHYRGSSALLLPMLGGGLFGAGAWLNGRCAFGTIATLGGGEVPRIGTLAGLFGGFALASWLGVHGPELNWTSPLVQVPASVLLAGSAAVSLAIALTLGQRLAVREDGGGWHPFVAMTVIGLVNGLLLVLAAGWPYTNLLMDLARSSGMDVVWRAVLAATFVLGAVVGAIAARDFRIETGSPVNWVRCCAGGLLMGIGATLVPGGNDTMLLVGLPLLLPNLLAAYLAMMGMMTCMAVFSRSRPRPARA